MHQVGVHCPVDKTLLSVVQWTNQTGGNSAQFFLQNPHTYQARNMEAEEWIRFCAETEANHISPLFIHAPYVVNLCAMNEQIREKSWKTVLRLLQTIQSKKDAYLVVHIGYHGGSGFEQGSCYFQESLEHIRSMVPLTKLTIENASGQTNSMGSSIEEISALLALFPDIGLCMDTAHSWGYGYSPDERFFTRKLVDWADKQVLKVIHLNNSLDAQGSKRDHHAKLNQGKIPPAALKSLARKMRTIPLVLETPKNTVEEDQEQISIIKDWLSV